MQVPGNKDDGRAIRRQFTISIQSKVVFSEYGIPKLLTSDAGGNFISEKFKNFCNSLNIEQAVSSLYHHKSNGQVEACIKFIKSTMKKCFDSGSDVHIALLQIRTTPIRQGLLSPATLLFNCQVRGIMPVMNRLPINTDNDEEHHKALVNRQCKNEQGKDTPKNFVSLPIGSTVAVQQEDWGPWTHRG